MSAEHSRSRYVQGCRCAICRKANRDYLRARRAAALALAWKHTQWSDGGPWGPGATRFVSPTATHGTDAGYTYHCCRCRECTTAQAEANRRKKKASS